MKSFKKILINVIAVVIALTACLGLVACEDIKKLEVTISIYDTDESAVVEKTLTVDLYRHLAPKTVDHIIDTVEDGYYNNVLLYKDGNYTSQIMMGDYVYENGEFKLNPVNVSTIDEEFKGTTGSNLKPTKGSIGLWRTWTAHADTYRDDGNLNTGKATWFMPESSLTSYDGWFTIFAQIDFEDETNNETFNAIQKLIGTANSSYKEYHAFYTGNYGTNGDGLTFNFLSDEEYDELDTDAINDIFKAEDDQYVCYNERVIRVPVATVGDVEQVTAIVKSVKVI